MFCRVTYDIPSARAAFDALHHLSLDQSKAEILADATFDDDGELLAVEVHVAQGQRQDGLAALTILGRIQIERKRLVAEVHSEPRRGRDGCRIIGA